MSELTSLVTERLMADLHENEVDANQKLNNSLRLLAKWRSELIKNTILKNNGTKVLDGPVKGLDFLERSAEGCHVAKLLGCYEQPLHEKLISPAPRRGATDPRPPPKTAQQGTH